MYIHICTYINIEEHLLQKFMYLDVQGLMGTGHGHFLRNNLDSKFQLNKVFNLFSKVLINFQ